MLVSLQIMAFSGTEFVGEVQSRATSSSLGVAGSHTALALALALPFIQRHLICMIVLGDLSREKGLTA